MRREKPKKTNSNSAYIEGAGIVAEEKITETLEKNYMPYAMSVIISRALPEIDGFKPSPYGLYETAATINRTWGFSAHDQNWKSPEIIAANRKKLNGMGINYLLNVGPDGLGRIPLASQKVLREAAKL